MTSNPLVSFSNGLADTVAAAASSVVQVQGGRRPASGVVYGSEVVLTMAGILGSAEGLKVRREDGAILGAELAGWDPATGVAVLRVATLGGVPIAPAATEARVGHLALAVGRSWSNAVSASAGIVAVIGGPLRTGRRRAIERVIRTTAPMHGGFTGGALLDAAGGLLGLVTSASIRETRVVVPADIAWNAAETILEHGQVKRGYLGVAGQPVRLPEGQRVGTREAALLVVGVTPGSPAAAAGILVGDLIVEVDGHPVESPEDLLDHLSGDRIGREASVRVLRGGATTTVPVTVGERPIS